jgi:hypothetical protein
MDVRRPRKTDVGRRPRGRAAGRWLALACCALAALATQARGGQGPAQPPQTGAQRARPARAPALLALVAEARALPGEYAADALLRLVETDKIKERAWRRALLEEAFRAAAAAQQPYKRRVATGLAYAYTREDYEARAFQLNLDALSLRLRAVNALLKFDKPRARALFAELPPKLPLAPLTCADALVPEVSDFYDTLTRVAQDAFSAEEKERGDDLLFVTPYLDALAAPAQVFPLARVVSRLGDTPERLAALLHAYTGALARVAADDRSFTAEMDTRVPAIVLLSLPARKQGVALEDTGAAFGAYYDRHKDAPHCADTAAAWSRPGQASRRLPDDLNDQLRQVAPRRAEPPADAPADVPSGDAGAARLTPYFTTPAAQSLFRTAQELRFGMADESEAEESAPKRAQQVRDWLNGLADWRASGEASEADYFNQRCVLYQLLLEVVPAEGPLGETLLREYVAYLRQPVRQQENRAGWLLHLQRLIASPRFQPPDARARLRAALVGSGDPVLRFYAVSAAARAQPKPAAP